MKRGVYFSLEERKEILEKFGLRTSESEEKLSEMKTMWSTFAEEQQKIGEARGIGIGEAKGLAKGEAKGSDRTAEAFKMLANGKTVDDIAAFLKIPYATAEEYETV